MTYLAGRPAASSTPQERVLVLSSANPVKNIPRLMEAFVDAFAGLPHQLVLLGHAPSGTDFAADAVLVGSSRAVCYLK